MLKGPSAFLYGRGDPGGTFNIVTKQPLAERSFAIGTQYGSYNQKRSTFDATGALDEEGRVLARVTGAVEDNSSFRDFVHGDRFYLAPVIAWKPTADTTITLEGEFLSTTATFDRASCRSTATSGPCRATASSASPASRRCATITLSASSASSTS